MTTYTAIIDLIDKLRTVISTLRKDNRELKAEIQVLKSRLREK